MTSRKLTTALVLETNNIRGERRASKAALARLLDRLRSQTVQPDELIVTHDGWSAEDQRELGTPRDQPIRFVPIPEGTGYYRAKNLGFDATTAEVVVFGDADCWPEHDWLERMIGPFADEQLGVVAGRTTYESDLFGIALTTIDFMYFDSAFGDDHTKNFYANNVAFRRDVFAAHRYRAIDGMYRGHCQVLALELSAHEIGILFEPRARTTHQLPDTLAHLVKLRLLRGADTVEFARHLARAELGDRYAWLGELGPLSPAAVLAGRFLFSLRSIGRQDMPEVRGIRKLACASAIAGVSMLDGAGALLGAFTGHRSAARDGNNLSYARDRSIA